MSRSRPWSILIVVALAVFAAAPANGLQADEQLQLLLSRAELLQHGGDPEGAISILDRLIVAGQQEGAALSASGRLMLRRGHELRGLLRWEAGQRNAVDADLDRVIELDPSYELAAEVFPNALRDRFRQRRERKVGYLRIGLFPADAMASVDGRELESLPELLAVLAGEHQVSARRPGFAPAAETAQVRANRTVGVSLELARASATVRLATRPPGAKLVVDGDVIGATVPATGSTENADEAASDPLLVEGLLPGWHEIEVTMPGYQPFRQRVDVPDLSDYDLGVLELARSEGIVLLRSLPADAAIRIDGNAATPTADPMAPRDTARLVLPVGEHFLVIDHGAAGSFERRVSIEEGRTLTLDVEVRPAIAWLGVTGGDGLDRDAVRAMVLPALTHPSWTLLDREADGGAMLDVAGVSAGDLLQEGVAGERMRAAVRARLQAGIYALAVLPAERPAATVQLLLWSAEATVAPWRLVIELGVPESLGSLSSALDSPLPSERAWIGLQAVDSLLSSGAVVLDVYPAGPAAQAGLAAGARIVGLDGQPLQRAAQLAERVAAARPFESVVLQVEGPSGASTVRVTLGSGSWVPGPAEWAGIDTVSWAALAAERGRSGSTTSDWALAMSQAMLAIRGGSPARAAELLVGLDVTAQGPFGRAALDYWLGTAQLAAGVDVEAARGALQAAAAPAGGRLSHNDGLLVAPAARARLQSLPPR